MFFGHFVIVSFAFVTLGLVSSTLSQGNKHDDNDDDETGWKERLQDHLFCVECDVSP